MIKSFKILVMSLIVNGCATADLSYMSGVNLHERDSYKQVLEKLEKNNFKIISDTIIPSKIKEDEGVRGIIAEGPSTQLGLCTHLTIIVYPNMHKDRGLQFMESKQVRCP